MKTILITLIMMFNFVIYSQIKHTGQIEMGMKQGVQTIHQNDLFNARFKYPDNTMYADLILDFNWKFVNFRQRIENNFCKKEGMKYFTPIDINFYSEISIRYKQLSIGYSHSCLHPVISEKENLNENWRRGNEDKIFIKISW